MNDINSPIAQHLIQTAQQMDWKPFTSAEQAIMDKIVEAHNAFIELGTEHPSEPDRWLYAIQDLQNILIYRAIKRLFPSEFK